MVKPNRLAPVWIELAVENREYFWPTLDDRCRATAQWLCLAPPVITHEVDDMFREVHFATQDCYSLTAGEIVFLFVANTSDAAEKL